LKQFSITSNDADQRLDKFLKKLFPNATLSFIYKLNRKGNIKIITQEKKKTKQDNEYKLCTGESVQVFLSDTDLQDLMRKQKQIPVTPVSEKLSKKDIIFQDDFLLVLNKNPGQNVHPADHKSKEISVIEQANDYLGERFSSLTFKPSLIHRIDRDTSGIVMIAKEKQTLTKLSTEFKNKKNLRKIYFAIVL
jgi:23S rRNA-/tRNA-specific pseudouridylate synthase